MLYAKPSLFVSVSLFTTIAEPFKNQWLPGTAFTTLMSGTASPVTCPP